jgi:hypothetical protein
MAFKKTVCMDASGRPVRMGIDLGAEIDWGPLEAVLGLKPGTIGPGNGVELAVMHLKSMQATIRSLQKKLAAAQAAVAGRAIPSQSSSIVSLSGGTKTGSRKTALVLDAENRAMRVDLERQRQRGGRRGPYRSR